MTEVQTSPRRRGAKLLAAAGLLGAVALAPALPAGAGIGGTFTATPSAVDYGDVLTLTATGCAAPGALELGVAVTLVDNPEAGANLVEVDGDGTATLAVEVSPEILAPGTYTFAAECFALFEDGPEDGELVFAYNEVTVTVGAVTPTTVTPPTSVTPTSVTPTSVTPTPNPSTAPTTAGRPAAGPVATPRFTG
jgi:hypothetical protein